MNQTAQNLIQAQTNSTDLLNLAAQLFTFTLADLEQSASSLTPVRIKALLQSVNAWDDAVLNEFERILKSGETAVRVTLYDILAQLNLSAEESIALRQTKATEEARWLPLILAVHAYKSGYPINNLDPSSPPSLHTPAGIILQQTGQFMRQQTIRSATERDRMAHKLAFSTEAAMPLDELPPSPSDISPAPPHFRTPVPVNYPEYTSDVTLSVEDVEAPPTPSSPVPSPPSAATLTITAEDIAPAPHPTPQRAPELRITYEHIEHANNTIAPRRPAQPRQPVIRQPTRNVPSQNSSSNFSLALRNLFATEEMKSTRLRINVLAYPEGPGLQAVQVKVSCNGIRSHVAGTTDRTGKFVCQLPVRPNGGLTYDIEVTWPRDDGGDTEQKSITLSADRTEFAIPFYQRTRV